MTAAEELILVDAALEKIYAACAQAVSAQQRSLTFLAMKDLVARKKELESDIQLADPDEAGGMALVQYGERV